MEHPTSIENKKVSFEELSKDDLVRKCYNLLSIAQKAKQSKNILQEEIDNLKAELSKTKTTSGGTEEMLNMLTEKNLNLTMTVDELRGHNKSILKKLENCEIESKENYEKLFLLDNENSSFKRQNQRLTDENEHLLGNLDVLEKQIMELSKLGASQHNQLLQLEEHHISETNGTLLDDNQSIHLNKMASLETEKEQLMLKIQNFMDTISKKDSSISHLEEQLHEKNSLVSDLSSKLQELEESLRVQSNMNETIETQLSIENKIMKEKVKIYSSKVVKFAGIVKLLKEDKNNILNLSKLYTDQVNTWKDQLQCFKEKCFIYIRNLEIENEELKLQVGSFLSREKELLYSFEAEKKCMEEKFENDIQQYKKGQNDIEKSNLEIHNLEKMLEEKGYQIANMLIEIDLYKKQIEAFGKERESSQILEELKLQHQQLVLENEGYKKEGESSIKQMNDLKAIIDASKTELITLKSEHAKLSESERNLLNDVKVLKEEKDNNNKYSMLLEEYQSKISNYETLLSTLKHEIQSSEELGVKSSQEIEKLMEENHILLSENSELKQSLGNIVNMQKNSHEIECQTELALATDLEQQLLDLKRENTELLGDMNEMNQELKERGENISKLEAHCEEVLKKLEIYEAQANKNIDNITEKEEVIVKLTNEIDMLMCNKNEEISQLKAEIEILNEKLNSNIDSSYPDGETMSTSTISRSDEVNRLKELEGSWEERYGKLRNLAVKLKGKIRELNNSLSLQQSENEELQKKLKTVQNLQSKCDTLEHDLEKTQKECKQYINRLNQIAHDISKDKQQLASKDEEIVDLKQKVELLNKEKQSTENWKKQVGAKVQTLRKDLESKDLLRKELELKINEMNSELQRKDELIKNEFESHNQTKALLEQLNDQSKKNSMLNLEMKDYERSLKEIAKKMDKQQEEVTLMKTQINSQKGIIEALKEENKLLADKLLKEEQNLCAANTETGVYKSKVDNLDENLKKKDAQVDSLMKLLETSRTEVEEISLELSKTISEHQKAQESLKLERDHLRNQNTIVQQNFRDLQEELNMKLGELTNIQNEYEGYKIRAQSVLRQSQSRDVGFEEKLFEEINSLKTKNSSLITEVGEYKRTVDKLEKTVEEITTEKDVYLKQMKEYESELTEVKLHHTQLQANYEKTIVENTETVRNLKIHADTLSQCYRQQLSEQEKRYNQEIIDLKLLLDNALTSTENVPILPTTPREEAEGSENTDTSNLPGMNPIPLEKLLESDSSQSVDKIQKLLAEQESKVFHLTSLLSETEKDLIKHVQMNNLLKEEIRRHQRSVEREKHAENLEYLKNVVVKFATLTSGDERSRLVPVLNTILKLSPEEAKQLNAVAKGESVLKGWTNYLPVWSPNKPQ